MLKGIYTPLMINCRRLGSLALLVSIVFLAGGCGGFSGSHSVSPASLFLPGLVQTPGMESTNGMGLSSEKDLVETNLKRTAALNQ